MLMMMSMACLRVWERCGFHYICEGNHKQHLSAAVQWKEPQEQHFLSISLKIDRLFKKSKHMKNHRWMNNWHISFDKTQRQRDICLYMRIKRWNNSFHVSVNCCVCGEDCVTTLPVAKLASKRNGEWQVLLVDCARRTIEISQLDDCFEA